MQTQLGVLESDVISVLMSWAHIDYLPWVAIGAFIAVGSCLMYMFSNNSTISCGRNCGTVS